MARLINILLQIRRPISIVLHAILVALANWGAFWLRFDGEVPEDFASMQFRLLPWLVLVRICSFVPFKLFEGLWKYTSLWDLRNILLGVAVSTAAFYPIAAMNAGAVRYPYSIYIVDAVLLVCFMAGVRLIRRIYGEFLRTQSGRRVLVYGAGDAGELIVRDMRQNAKFDMTPVGFVDDDPRKVGQRIHGVPVLGGLQQLPQIFKAHAPEELLLAIPSASRESLRRVVRAVEPYKIRITTLPRLHDLIGTRIQVGQIRQLKVADLLARDPVGLDDAVVNEFLRGKRIVVTGAGGSIGSELCRQIAAARPASLILLERYENGLFCIHSELVKSFADVKLYPVVADVTDARRIDQVFRDLTPQIVFHAAAHKHVPLMEDNPCEAVKNNVRGTRVVAESAQRHGVARFVLISTDKAVNPTSVMGTTKRVAELIVDGLSRKAGTRFAAVRFGNVLGSNGSVVPTFLDQIEKGGPVTVTHPEMRRFFMLIPEAVQLVLHVGALDDNAPLFLLEMGEQVKVVEMARDLIRLSGYVPDKDIAIEFTGMRPGEKLFEELVAEGEWTEPSSVAKILRVQNVVAAHKGAPHDNAIARIEDLALEGCSDEVVRELNTLVAGFTIPAANRTENAPA